MQRSDAPKRRNTPEELAEKERKRAIIAAAMERARLQGSSSTPPAQRRTMNAAKRHDIFSRFRAANPHPTTELEYTHAVRTADRRAAVGPGHRRRRQQGHAQAVPGGQHAGRDPGAGRRRTEALHPDHRPVPHQGEERDRHLPDPDRTARRRSAARPREALEALPGVGRKTANVVLNTAFGEPTIAVDTHIFRVSNRTGIAPGKNVDVVEQKLLKFVPQGIPARRPPLADPARPLHLHRAQAAMLELHDRRPVRIQGQDARARSALSWLPVPGPAAPPLGAPR